MEKTMELRIRLKLDYEGYEKLDKKRKHRQLTDYIQRLVDKDLGVLDGCNSNSQVTLPNDLVDNISTLEKEIAELKSRMLKLENNQITPTEFIKEKEILVTDIIMNFPSLASLREVGVEIVEEQLIAKYFELKAYSDAGMIKKGGSLESSDVAEILGSIVKVEGKEEQAYFLEGLLKSLVGVVEKKEQVKPVKKPSKEVANKLKMMMDI